MPANTESASPRAVLAAVCASLSVTTMNISFLNVGLPTISRQLGSSNTGLEWIVDAYALVFAGLLLAAGSLGDRIGRKATLLTGLVIFGASSLAATLVHSTGALIAARCVMGAGAACVMPMTLSILTDIYTSEDGLRRAIGVWAATASAAAVAAPVCAGLLLTYLWWGSLFAVNVPACVVVTVAVWAVVPESERRPGVPIDWMGVVLSVLFSAGLVTSLIEGPDRGWGSPLVLGGLAGSAILLAAFCAWELRTRHPLVNIRFFRQPTFSVGCILVALQYFFSFGVAFAVTQYLQLVLGYSALVAGLALVPSAALLMVVAPLGARAFGRFTPRTVTSIAMVILGLSGCSLAAIGAHSGYWPILVSLLLNGLGIGLMAAGTTSMVMRAVPAEQSGMASGTQSATRQLGGALGVAVIGSLLQAKYASALTASVAGTPGAPFRAQARRSLAAAVDLPQAPAPVRQLLARLGRAAFSDGMDVVGLAVILTGAVGAGLVVVMLRRDRPAAFGQEASDSPGAAAGLSGAAPDSLQ